MFRKFHEKLKEHEEGFTLIELLVVILIIAILAAIAIPVFLKQREKGWISQMESALKNATTAAESFASGAGAGNYKLGPTDTAAMTKANLVTEGWKYADSVVVTDANVTVSADGNKYCIQVGHASIDDTDRRDPMAISSESTTPKEGSCADGVFTPTPV